MDRLERRVDRLDDDLDEVVAGAGGGIAAIRSSVEQLESRVDDLDQSLFGFSGSSFETDVIGDLRRDLASIDSCLRALTQAIARSAYVTC